MQLKMRRSQTTTGLLSKAALFILDARADLTNEERESVRKYSLGKEVVYASDDAKRHAEAAKDATGFVKGAFALARARLSLIVTVDSLSRGQRVECKNLMEILAAEEAIMTACQNLKLFLQTAVTFDGREQVVDI